MQKGKEVTGVKAIRRQNLESLLARYRTKAEFARAVGTAPAYVSQILSAASRGEIGDDFARRCEKACGKPEGWMDERHDVAEKKKWRGTVPLVPWEKVSTWGEEVTAAKRIVDTLEEQPAPGAYERVKTTVEVGELTHAYQVMSDAMNDEFPKDSLIVVEPAMQPRSGDYVVAVLPNGVGTFRQLVDESGVRYFKALNPAYPTQRVPEGTSIVGVVREMIRRYR